VPEQPLYGAEIRALVQQVCREALCHIPDYASLTNTKRLWALLDAAFTAEWVTMMRHSPVASRRNPFEDISRLSKDWYTP